MLAIIRAFYFGEPARLPHSATVTPQHALESTPRDSRHMLRLGQRNALVPVLILSDDISEPASATMLPLASLVVNDACLACGDSASD